MMREIDVMAEQNAKLFSTAALVVLNNQAFDPAAKGRYENLSGGLIWGDEFPVSGTPEWEAIDENFTNFAYRYLVAYRASITLGKEREAFQGVWNQVMAFAPNWPGLRPERRGERAKKRLLAAKRQEAVCLEGLEKEISATDSEA
jgi:hypothetical protein